MGGSRARDKPRGLSNRYGNPKASFARGEIDKAEFEEKRRIIGEA
jgi:hypothetical protein